MDCNLDKNLLQDLLDDSADPVEKLFVQEHLKVCRKCRKEFNSLKLLFWELQHKENFAAEIPAELDQARDLIIDGVLGVQEKTLAGRIIEQQGKTLKASGTFLEFVPGAAAGSQAVKQGAKAVPEVLGKASRGLLKKGAKLLMAK